MVEVVVTLTSETLEDLDKRMRYITPTLADRFQIDFVDGKFAPRKTLTLKNLKRVQFPKPIELHLMVQEPEHYFADIVLLRPAMTYFHLEGCRNPKALLDQLQQAGLKAGLAILMETPVRVLQPYLDRLDGVLLLAVKPGFYGSQHQNQVLEKIRTLRGLASELDIEVDGGINLQTGASCVQAGANILASGSFVYKAPDASVAVQTLKSL